TLVKRELVRTYKVINQVIWPPLITTVLYVLVFGLGLGSRVQSVQGVPYAAFLIPGLIMLQVIDQTYGEASSSLFQSRFLMAIQEVLIAPMSAVEIVTGYIVAAILRALLIAVLITAVGFAMVHTLPQNWTLYFGVAILVATLFGALGLICGLLAEKFDHIAVLTTFVITPLVFVGGVFTTSQLLPPLVREISYFNPMFYMIDAFRYSFTGRSDVPLGLSLGVVSALTVLALGIALSMTAAGYKLRT
ncbi:MAG TPA: ABC transporter permease, partial [Candidatus Baltobacteraceae bacterium]|nr:ABC transporter permease [Candidatus Baltobacteraceae bacterium]